MNKHILGAVTALAILPCGAFAQEPLELRIGAASNVIFGPIFALADPSTGIAAKHGLKVESRLFNSGIATMEAAMAGDLDVAFPNTRVLLPLLQRGDACFKGGIGFVDVNSVQMVATNDIQAPADLIGKKVGTRVGGIGQVALDMWLAEVGVDRSKVDVVNLAEEDQPIALVNGNVDAIIWPEPVPSMALKIGGDKVHRFGDIGKAFRDTSVVNVTCDWVEKNGDEGMERLVAAFLDAINYMKQNPQQGIELTAKALQLDPIDVESFWQSSGWPAGWSGDLTDDQIDMYTKYQNFLIETGDLTGPMDFGTWLSSKWLEKVAPDQVKFQKYKL